MKNLGILLSGRGSNFDAIANNIASGKLGANIAVVISNKADAPGIESARRRELKALVEIEKEDWARNMQRLLRRACHAAGLARTRPSSRTPIDRAHRTPIRRRRRPRIGLSRGPKPDRASAEEKRRRAARPKNPAEPATISSYACKPARKTRCASFTIPACPSPTTRPRGMAG